MLRLFNACLPMTHKKATLIKDALLLLLIHRVDQRHLHTVCLCTPRPFSMQIN